MCIQLWLSMNNYPIMQAHLKVKWVFNYTKYLPPEYQLTHKS